MLPLLGVLGGIGQAAATAAQALPQALTGGKKEADPNEIG
jgi:hypothetical protein